jgi:2-keto-3-deoxy-L-rhamnonate aldolase RhmA
MRVNPVKKALKQGQVQVGCGFGQLRSIDVAKILAAAGFHWTFLDTEHGSFDIETVQDLCRAAVAAGVTPLVRVADMQYALVARALDCGAQGVIFPRVESPDLLARAISWTQFPPAGVRGFGLGPQHIDYERAAIPDVLAHMNENIMAVLQIETVRAVEARNELLAIPGIDAVMIGPVDLSISLGVPGEFDHPKMVDAIEKIRDASNAYGIAPGIHTRTVALAKTWKSRGMRFLGSGAETGYLLEKATEVATELKK